MKNKYDLNIKEILFLATCFLLVNSAFSQVGIGTINPSSSSALDVTSTTKGMLVPRMTLAQKTAIVSPATGLLIYQTNGASGFWYYNGTTWIPFAASAGWSLTGDSGTLPATNKVGTIDAQDIKIVTNNTEAVRVASNGNVGIGTSTPTTKLHIVASTPATVLLNDGFEDNTIPPFITGGDVNWIITNSPVNSGTKAAQSGVIAPNQTSWIETSATFPSQGGTISFALNVNSSQPCCDLLTFLIDGVAVTSLGSIPYTNMSFPVLQGTHTFRWSYNKNAAIDLVSDAAYLDDVVISENPPPALRIVDENQGVGKILTSDATGLATWKPAPKIITTDNDWIWDSGSTNFDPIFHRGNVKIGSTTPSIYNLHVYNGTPLGSRAAWGSVEYVTDGVDEFLESHHFSPVTDNSINAGSGSKRWTAVYAANGVINTSDVRDKMNIKPLHYGIDEIMKMEPISFKWKEENESGFKIPDTEKETKLGFIAQDVQKIIPEVIETHQWKVYEENPGVLINEEMPRMGISYSEIIPVIVKSIQEQQLQIEKIKATNENLRTLISQLKK